MGHECNFQGPPPPRLICEEAISGVDSKAYSEYYFQLLEGMKLAGK